MTNNLPRSNIFRYIIIQIGTFPPTIWPIVTFAWLLAYMLENDAHPYVGWKYKRYQRIHNYLRGPAPYMYLMYPRLFPWEYMNTYNPLKVIQHQNISWLSSPGLNSICSCSQTIYKDVFICCKITLLCFKSKLHFDDVHCALFDVS